MITALCGAGSFTTQKDQLLGKATMKNKIILLATLFVAFSSIVFATSAFTATRADARALNAGQPAQSYFAGNYTGEWTAKFVNGSEQEAEGTWRISISGDGSIKGVETDKTSDQRGEISGFINDEGYTKVFVKYDSGRVTIKGVLEDAGSRLTGTLEQTCNSTNDLCANVDIILKRN